MAAQALFAEVQPYLNFEQGEVTMFVMDMPDVPPQYAPVVIAQALQAQPPTQPDSTKVDRSIGVCHLAQNPPIPPGTAVNVISPLGSTSAYFNKLEQRWVGLEGKVTVLQGPEHGTLKDIGSGYYHFAPEHAYHGPDRATVLVEIGGLKVKVMYFFKVMHGVGGTEGYDPYRDKDNCPNGRYWKISFNNESGSAGPLLTFNSPNQLTSYLAGAVNVDITLADLTDGAVGQTTGTTITLDDNAAGHGWFIDSTPGSNEEFLPTHNPNEWIAQRLKGD